MSGPIHHLRPRVPTRCQGQSLIPVSPFPALLLYPGLQGPLAAALSPAALRRDPAWRGEDQSASGVAAPGDLPHARPRASAALPSPGASLE